jgi:uncharacterized protein (DUF433 family)
MLHSSVTEVMPLEVDQDGTVRVGKTRVTLDTVIAAFTEGATAEEIVQQYPSLQLADVYHVIGSNLARTSVTSVGNETDLIRSKPTRRAAAVGCEQDGVSEAWGVWRGTRLSTPGASAGSGCLAGRQSVSGTACPPGGL